MANANEFVITEHRCEMCKSYGPSAGCQANIADELRDTRRALWLAREWRAWCEVEFWSIAEGDKPKDVFHLSCTKRVHRMPITWVAYWQKVARKCKVKAEEYK